MKRSTCFFLCLLLAATFAVATHAQNASSPAKADSQARAKTIRVLFIGNSMTHLHDLPGTVARLAASANPPRQLEAVESTEGGYTLKRHWESGRALDAIRSGKWDFVVLQEQGGLGGATLNDKGEINDPRMTAEHARRFDVEIRKAGARTILFLNWAGQASPHEIALLAKLHGGLAAELQSGIAPIGVAWHAALRENPKLALHWSDGGHPNAAGSYLAACVLYSTFYSRSPEGLSNGNLAAADAAFLQRIAWQAARDPQRAIAAALGEKFAPAASAASLPAPAATAVELERGRAILTAAQTAAGGRERLRGLRDLSLAYSGKLAGPEGDIPVSARDIFVFPDVLRTEMQFGAATMIIFFDGNTGWRKTPQGLSDFTEVLKKTYRAHIVRTTFNLLRDAADLSVKFEKREKVGDVEVDVILLTREAESARLFVNPANGAILKRSFRGMGLGGMADFDEMYFDYREVAGVQVPFRIVTYQNGSLLMEATVNEVKINSGVDPADLARKPAP